MKKRIIGMFMIGIMSCAIEARNDSMTRAPRLAMDEVPCDIPRLERTDGQMVVLPYNVMVELVKVLDKVVDRAPRPDAPTLASAAFPVSFDCADIDLIRRCVCLMKQQLTVICTKLDFIIAEIASCCEGIFEEFSVVETAIANAVESICECVELSNSAQSELLTSIIETVGANTAATVCECINTSNASQTDLLVSVIDQAAAGSAATACECITLSNSAQSELLTSIIESMGSNTAATVCECIAVGLSLTDIFLTSIIENAASGAGQQACNCINLSNSAQSELLTSIIETAGASTAATVCDCVSNGFSIQEALINSRFDNLVSPAVTCCDTIGNVTDQGSCFDSQLANVNSAINDANLTVIQWLKTIMLELRGCSCGGTNPCQPCGPGMTCVDAATFGQLASCCDAVAARTCIDLSVICPNCVGLGAMICVTPDNLDALLTCLAICINPL